MPEQARLQVRTSGDQQPWEDVGHGSDEQKVPVSVFDSSPVASSKQNPSFELSYDVDDNLTQVDMIVGAITYRKTLTWAGGVLTAVTAWSEV